MVSTGLPGVGFSHGRPRLSAGFTAEREGRRHYSDLAAVAAVGPGRAGGRIQYWTFAGVAAAAQRQELERTPVSYDLTVLTGRPMGWERPKTHGHVHVAHESPGLSYPELYEVLEGRAGFLVQDLRSGPSSTFVALIEASEGQIVILPPFLHHATINLGTTPLVIGDLVCRSSDDDYNQLRSAHGMAYYIGVGDEVVPNPNYRSAPALQRLGANDWSGSWRGPLYERLVTDRALLEWLCTRSSIDSVDWRTAHQVAVPDGLAG